MVAKDLLAHSTLIRAPLSRRHADVIELHERIKSICDQYLFGDDVPESVFALGFFDRDGDGKEVIRYPLFLPSPSLSQDPQVLANQRRASEDSLVIGVYEGIVGLALKTLTSPDATPLLPLGRKEAQALYNLIAEDIWTSRHYKIPIIEFGTLRRRYQGYFQKPWSAADDVDTHLVVPIAFDRVGSFPTKFHLGAAVAMDFRGSLGKPARDRIENVLQLIEGVVSTAYLLYFSGLGWPEHARRLLTLDWKWSDSGRVFGRLYWQRIEDALDEQSTSHGAATVKHPETSSDSLLRMSRCVIIYCDGNGVKNLNDRHTHHLGNEVIRLMGSVLAQAAEQTRRSCCDCCLNEAVVRWGGDEFIVVFSLRLDGAMDAGSTLVRIFQRLVRQLLRTATSDLQEQLVRGNSSAAAAAISGRRTPSQLREEIGIAMGWAEWRKDSSETFSRVILARAERAMYVAKEMMTFYREQFKSAESELDEQSRLGSTGSTSQAEVGGRLLAATAIGFSDLTQIQLRLEERAAALEE